MGSKMSAARFIALGSVAFVAASLSGCGGDGPAPTSAPAAGCTTGIKYNNGDGTACVVMDAETLASTTISDGCCSVMDECKTLGAVSECSGDFAAIFGVPADKKVCEETNCTMALQETEIV